MPVPAIGNEGAEPNVLRMVRSLSGAKGIYRTPDGRYAARYARFSQRGAGMITDLGICFWVPYVLLGTLTSYLSTSSGATPHPLDPAGLSWITAVALCFLGYFTITMARGRTLGMRIFGMRILEPVSGRPPGYRRALVRALILFLFGVAAFVLFNYTLSQPSAGTSRALSQTILVGGFVIFLAGMWSHLWMIFDSRGQAVHDHIAGVVVIEKLIEIPEDIELYAASGASSTTPVRRAPAAAQANAAAAKRPSSVSATPEVHYVNPRSQRSSRARRHGGGRSHNRSGGR